MKILIPEDFFELFHVERAEIREFMDKELQEVIASVESSLVGTTDYVKTTLYFRIGRIALSSEHRISWHLGSRKCRASMVSGTVYDCLAERELIRYCDSLLIEETNPLNP